MKKSKRSALRFNVIRNPGCDVLGVDRDYAQEDPGGVNGRQQAANHGGGVPEPGGQGRWVGGTGAGTLGSARWFGYGIKQNSHLFKQVSGRMATLLEPALKNLFRTLEAAFRSIQRGMGY